MKWSPNVVAGPEAHRAVTANTMKNSTLAKWLGGRAAFQRRLITETQYRHMERFDRWRLKLRDFLTEKRGRSSRLAEHLGVKRQSVSRWFVTGVERNRTVPAWAAVVAKIWHQSEVVRLASDKPMGRFVRRSQDKPSTSLSAWGATTVRLTCPVSS